MYKPLRERVLSLLLVRCLGDGPAESQSKYMFRLIANGRDFLESGGSSASPAAARGGPHAHGSPAAPRRLLTLPGRAVGFVSHFPTRFHVRAIHSHIFFCELSVQTFSLFFMFKNAFIADVCMSFILPGYLFDTTHIF